MKHAHEMAFGANPENGGIAFSLWAPAASEAAVVLSGEAGNERVLGMTAAGEGRFALRTDEARAGDEYRYRVNGAAVPDPASRYQPDGVHGPSRILDPRGYEWRDEEWMGRPWEEAVIYELHVGTFSPAGSFDGVRERLGDLAELGVTAVELMPVAAFSGTRGWGYDGVLPFAPSAAYGTPDDLKRLVDAAHGTGLMVLLDVVYNHFGPDGNYLRVYAPQFFTERFHTPWGEAIDFGQREVREFFIHNALYWLEEYRFDGLRLDAVHAIRDESRPDILEELADRVRDAFEGKRRIHLVLENARNESRYLAREESGRPALYVAQWNDDLHHALHVLATQEDAGYYEAYADDPSRHLCRCFAEGFAFQGERFPHWNEGRRGEPSGHLPPTAFVSFVQNHDQVGNRAFGERIDTLANPEAVEALLGVLLLAPSPPLLFMGQEWGAEEPFLFFCDFHDELADSVREGRRREFARFPAFADEAARARIPDPNAVDTFRRARLEWDRRHDPAHAQRLDFVRNLLRLRAREIAPRLVGGPPRPLPCERFGEGCVHGRWKLADGSSLAVVANLSPSEIRGAPQPSLPLLAAVGPGGAWTVRWFLG